MLFGNADPVADAGARANTDTGADAETDANARADAGADTGTIPNARAIAGADTRANAEIDPDANTQVIAASLAKPIAGMPLAGRSPFFEGINTRLYASNALPFSGRC